MGLFDAAKKKLDNYLGEMKRREETEMAYQKIARPKVEAARMQARLEAEIAQAKAYGKQSAAPKGNPFAGIIESASNPANVRRAGEIWGTGNAGFSGDAVNRGLFGGQASTRERVVYRRPVKKARTKIVYVEREPRNEGGFDNPYL